MAVLATTPVSEFGVGDLSAEQFCTSFRARQPLKLRGAVASWPACTLWLDRATLADRLGGEGAQLSCEISASGHFIPGRRTTTASTFFVSEVLDQTLFLQSTKPASLAQSDMPTSEQSTRATLPPTRSFKPTDRPCKPSLYCKLQLTAALNGDLADMPCGMVASECRPSETRFWLGMQGNGETQGSLSFLPFKPYFSYRFLSYLASSSSTYPRPPHRLSHVAALRPLPLSRCADRGQ